MKVTILQEDIDKALSEIPVQKVTRCCPIFQALKRAGCDIYIVGLDRIMLMNDRVYSLGSVGISITLMPREQWQTIEIGTEVEVLEL